MTNQANHSPHVVTAGNRILHGEYHLHSAFPRARNFFCNEALVSLVSSEIGPAGFHVVWNSETLPMPQCEIVKVSSHGISLDDFFIPHSKIVFFESEWRCEEYIHWHKNKAQHIAQLLPLSGFSFLIKTSSHQSFSCFEKQVEEAAHRALNFFYDGNLEQCVRSMRGLGSGLTPSGDDFLCGMLAAYTILENSINNNKEALPFPNPFPPSQKAILKHEIALKRETILKNALGTNMLSNAFLHAAANGVFSVRQLHFFNACLQHTTENNLCTAVANLVAIGATSGTDFAVGFLQTMERENAT